MRYFVLSERKIRMMRYIDTHNVKVHHLRGANQNTLWALLHRSRYHPAMAMVRGSDVLLTPEGVERLRKFSGAEFVARQFEDDLSRRVKAIVNVVRGMRRVA